MMKFFRKHNRKLLAVFMAGLLIVWLGGSALMSLVDPTLRDQLIAKSQLGDILADDQIVARLETEMLELVGLDWRNPWPFSGLRAQAQPLGIMEWILLTREANGLGMKPRQVEVEAFVTNLGLTLETVEVLAARRNIKSDFIYHSLGNFMSVFQMLRFTVGAETASEAEIRVAARDQLETVQINLVKLDARSLVDRNEVIEEAEIQEHFETYRESVPGGGVLFGYYQPAKVKIQYFKIDPAVIAKNLIVRENTLLRKAEDYWRANRNNAMFARPNPTTPPTAGEDEDPSPYFATFEEAQAVAVREVRRVMGIDEVAKIASWLVKELSEPWFGLPVGDDGYPVPPAELLGEDYYSKVLDRLPANLRFGGAVTIGTTKHFTKEEAFQLPGIGASRPQIGTDRRTFRNVVFHVQGVESMPLDTAVDTATYLALGQSSSIWYANTDNETYIYRVLEVIPPGPGESLEEVREKVIDDIRMQRGYEQVLTLAEDFAYLITDDGLFATWQNSPSVSSLPDPAPGYFTPDPLARRVNRSIPTTSMTENIFVRGLGVVTPDFVEKCFAMESSGQKVRVIPMDDKAIVAIVEFTERRPLDEERFKQERGRIVRELNDGLVAKAIGQWLDPVRIRDRNNYQPSTQ